MPGTPNPLQKVIFTANHQSDLDLHSAIVLIEAAGKRKREKKSARIKRAAVAAGSKADIFKPIDAFKVKGHT